MVEKLELSQHTKHFKSIKNYKIKNVMIHDAARPNFSLKLLDKLLKN